MEKKKKKSEREKKSCIKRGERKRKRRRGKRRRKKIELEIMCEEGISVKNKQNNEKKMNLSEVITRVNVIEVDLQPGRTCRGQSISPQE